MANGKISDNTLKQLEQILAKRQKYIVKNNKNKRDIDAINGTLGDVLHVLATLLDDLRKQGIVK